ncbi:uncharacterized protein LOC133358834 [Lethenteron reissneri]|uniref:uncharacterized protein LOC133358711 n=1 Tax=Lethenteron reissneri TaxID=7753 RepID=UPI002AB7751A|nr:uncharacterized protein LOC133358711 [Lethenteron reissneri]XP_061433265.1 uncharacterized protein LOC133358834 [Lethenteron reissneri]
MSAIEGLRANLQQLTAKLQGDLKPALEAAALKLRTAVEEASVAASRASDTVSAQLEAWRGRLELMVPNTVDALHALAHRYPAMQAPLARLEEKVPHLDVVLPLAAVLLAAALVAVAYGRLRGGKRGPAVETTSGRPDGKKKKKKQEKKAVAEEGNLHHAPRQSAVSSGSGGGHQHLQMDAATLEALAERLYRVLKVEPFVVKGSRDCDERPPPPPPPPPGRGVDASPAEGAVSPGVKKKERKEKKSGRHVEHKATEVANAAGNHERAVDGSDGELKNSVHAAEADGEHTVAEDGHGKDSHEE